MGSWPDRDQLEKIMNEIMGNTKGRTVQPHGEMKLNRSFRKALASRLNLQLDSVPELYSGELVRCILEGTIQKYDVMGYPNRNNLQAAGELLGFSMVSDDRVNEALAEINPDWLNEEQRQLRRQAKTFRVFVALIAHGKPRISGRQAQKYQLKFWVPAAVDALELYLVDHSDEARRIALSALGLDVAMGEPVKASPDEGASTEPGAEADSDGIPIADIVRPAAYVHRPAVEAEFGVLVASGAKLIALIGLPGVGKSSLAHALTEGGPFLELQGGQLPLMDLIPALEACGLEVDDRLNADSAWRQLAKLVTMKDGPEFVVLDNLNNVSELRERLPRNTKSLIVVTCREWSDTAPEWYGRIDVGGMTSDEAAQMVGSLLPSLTPAEREFAAQAFNYYPLLIRAGCALVTTTGASLDDVYFYFRKSPDSLMTSTGEKLEEVLGRLITALDEPARYETYLLALVVSTVQVKGSEIIAQSPWPTLDSLRVFFGDPNPSGYAKCLEALTVLQNLGLVYVVVYVAGKENPRNYVTIRMHLFVRSMLTRIMDDTMNRVGLFLWTRSELVRDALVSRIDNNELDGSLLELLDKHRLLEMLRWRTGVGRFDFFEVIEKLQGKIQSTMEANYEAALAREEDISTVQAAQQRLDELHAAKAVRQRLDQVLDGALHQVDLLTEWLDLLRRPSS